MIFELFVLGGVAFWILSGAMFLLLLWAASDDRAVVTGLLLAGYVAAIYLFGNASTLSMPDPWVFYIGIPAYFLVGTGWGIGKWYLFVSRQVMSYKEARQEFLINAGIAHATVDMVVPVRLKAKWKRTRWHRFSRRPIARQNKRRIISWMCFWPTSMIWAVIDEPWRRIYTAIASLLQRIADSVYDKAGVDSDLKGPDNLMDAIEGQILAYDLDGEEWSKVHVAEVLQLAVHEMEMNEIRVRPTADGHVHLIVPTGQPVPHLPAEIKGVSIDVMSPEVPVLEPGTDPDFRPVRPGMPLDLPGKPAK